MITREQFQQQEFGNEKTETLEPGLEINGFYEKLYHGLQEQLIQTRENIDQTTLGFKSEIDINIGEVRDQDSQDELKDIKIETDIAQAEATQDLNKINKETESLVREGAWQKIKDVGEEFLDKALSELTKERENQLGMGMVKFGNMVKEMKDDFFAKSLNKSAELFEKKSADGEVIVEQEQGGTYRFLSSFGEKYAKEAKQARNNYENPQNTLLSRTSAVAGLLKTSRIIFDVGVANPFRNVMAASLFIGRSADAVKEACFKGSRLQEQTRINDTEKAYDEARIIYEKAKKENKEVPTSQELDKAYGENLPKYLMERLSEEDGINTSLIQQFATRRIEKINQQLQSIENDPVLSFESKRIKKYQLMQKHQEYLSDMDKILTQAGTVDLIAYSARVIKKGSEATTKVMLMETLIKMPEIISHFLKEASELTFVSEAQAAEIEVYEKVSVSGPAFTPEGYEEMRVGTSRPATREDIENLLPKPTLEKYAAESTYRNELLRYKQALERPESYEISRTQSGVVLETAGEGISHGAPEEAFDESDFEFKRMEEEMFSGEQNFEETLEDIEKPIEAYGLVGNKEIHMEAVLKNFPVGAKLASGESNLSQILDEIKQNPETKVELMSSIDQRIGQFNKIFDKVEQGDKQKTLKVILGQLELLRDELK